MLTFRNEGVNVIAAIDTKTAVDKNLWLFKFKLDYEAAAAMCANALDRKLDDLIGDIRREAYEQGWRDAKAKRRKLKEFFVHMKADGSVGY